MGPLEVAVVVLMVAVPVGAVLLVVWLINRRLGR
jgi:hypothetical protein